MSGSGISWATCKSVPRSSQITTPAPHHSVFLQTRCPSCRPTNSVKALKARIAAKSLTKNWSLKIWSQFSYNIFGSRSWRSLHFYAPPIQVTLQIGHKMTFEKMATWPLSTLMNVSWLCCRRADMFTNCRNYFNELIKRITLSICKWLNVNVHWSRLFTELNPASPIWQRASYGHQLLQLLQLGAEYHLLQVQHRLMLQPEGNTHTATIMIAHFPCKIM